MSESEDEKPKKKSLLRSLSGKSIGKSPSRKGSLRRSGSFGRASFTRSGSFGRSTSISLSASSLHPPPSTEILELMRSEKTRSVGVERLEEEVRSLVTKEDFDMLERMLLRAQDDFLFPLEDPDKAVLGLLILSITMQQLDTHVPRFLNTAMSMVIKFYWESPPELVELAQSRVFEMALLCVFSPTLMVSSGGRYLDELRQIFQEMPMDERKRVFDKFPDLYKEMVLTCIDKRMDEDVAIRAASLNVLRELLHSREVAPKAGVVAFFQRFPAVLKFCFEGMGGAAPDEKLAEAARKMDEAMREAIEGNNEEINCKKIASMAEQTKESRHENIRRSSQAWNVTLAEAEPIGILKSEG